MLLAAKALPWRGILLFVAFMAPWAATAWQAHQRHKAEDALEVAEARVTALKAAGDAKEAEYRLNEKAWLRATTRYVDETVARIETGILARDALSARVCSGALAARRGEVPATATGAGGSDGPAPEPRSEGEALDAYDRACGIDAEWLAFWQRYAANVGVEVSGGQ